MRNMILAALALSSLVPVRHADACGGYLIEPVVYRLSSHDVIDLDRTTEHRRTFALIAETAPAKGLAWRQLSPMSYDMTSIADASPFAYPVTLTLVGPAGTRVVTSKKHVFLSRSWDFKGDTGAIEVSDHGDFAIAIAGSYADVEWRALDESTPSAKQKKALAAWVKTQGVTPWSADSLYTSRVGDVETITLFPENGTKMITLVRRGTENLGRFDGSPLGAYKLFGTTKLVLVDGASVQSVAI